MPNTKDIIRRIQQNSPNLATFTQPPLLRQNTLDKQATLATLLQSNKETAIQIADSLENMAKEEEKVVPLQELTRRNSL